jgi:hypothetical protein
MRVTVFFLVISLLLSCSLSNEEEGKKAVAKVKDKFLYLEDLEGVVPKDATTEDSTLIAQNYIQGWIKENLILQKAELNLKENQLDFKKQLEDYRKSLIIYSYEKALIKQKLDTTVTRAEIEDFYESNKQQFELKDDIVKVKYLKVLKTAPKVKKIRKLYKSEKEEDIEKINELAHQYSEKFHLDDNQWVLFDELKKEVPIKASQTQNFLKHIKNIEVEDSLSYYFVRIKDYKLEKDVSPLNFEKHNIKNIIINKRKLKLINSIKAELYQEAFLNKDIEIYENQNNEE